ncbi:MAG TPA: threonine ammonia-lyase, biosynthetic, partial [Ferrovaceae bacterium]|nr:threonine ammonia-lyase, biosynthetic [Ferrovaceae bacterium]
MKIDYLEKILNATRVYDVAIETPLQIAPNLTERLHNTVLLKREDMQSVFSFKLRGAYNKMVSLTPKEAKKGVIAASAGNHAQGVALSAQRLGMRAVIVMPITTPSIKIDAVKARGAEVVLNGVSYSEAYEYALKLAAQKGYTFVHPYDDPEVIAGQGTIAMEILRQYSKPIHSIYVAIGGGGLISGVAAYVKRLRPDVRIVGVQPVDSDAMRQSLIANRRVKLDQVGLFADGVAVRQVGVETFKLCKEWVDEIVTVSTDEICAAIKDVFDDTRAVLEPAGALAVAGMKYVVKRDKLKNQNLVAIACGANINFDRLRFIAERAELGEQREAVFAATIPEEPGSFKAFCDLLGDRSVTEFNYRYADSAQAQVFVGVSIAHQPEKQQLFKKLKQHGIDCVDLTDNEMAKLHVRHMVGGHAPRV